MPKPTVTDAGGNVLVEGKDYELRYANNINAGTAKITVVCRGDYVGETTVEFEIAPTKITSAVGADKTYNGKAQTTTWTVKAGSLAVPAAGYTVSAYKTNTNAGTATAMVKGKGNFTGSVTGKFKISPAKITAVATKASVAYTGKAVKPKLTVKAGSATVAASGYTATWSNNTKAGTATVSVTGKGNYTGSAKTTFKIVAPTVQYKVHRQTYGWETEWKRNGDQSGTVGESKRLEGIYVMLGKDFPVSGGIRYKTHGQRNGWEPDWRYSGQLSGTLGESKRLEAIRIELTGDMAKAYDVYYRVHAQQLGWMGWAKNGADAGTAGYSYRLEAIQIVLVPKGGAAPAKTLKGATQKVAQAFVQK